MFALLQIVGKTFQHRCVELLPPSGKRNRLMAAMLPSLLSYVLIDGPALQRSPSELNS